MPNAAIACACVGSSVPAISSIASSNAVHISNNCAVVLMSLEAPIGKHSAPLIVLIAPATHGSSPKFTSFIASANPLMTVWTCCCCM